MAAGAPRSGQRGLALVLVLACARFMALRLWQRLGSKRPMHLVSALSEGNTAGFFALFSGSLKCTWLGNSRGNQCVCEGGTVCGRDEGGSSPRSLHCPCPRTRMKVSVPLARAKKPQQVALP